MYTGGVVLRKIEFRQWSSGSFHYWGVGCDSFTGPLSNRLDITSEQFTGLRDKNGKKIFEGDVVQDDAKIGRAGVIQFALGHFGVNWDYANNIDPEWKEGTIYGGWGTKTNLRRVDDGFLDDFEVIGNIHENPELLEVEK